MKTMLRLEQCPHELPIEFVALEADARVDGHRHLTRLADEMSKSPDVFHAVFACYVGCHLAGIGAITDEPTLPSKSTWRMRRLYVHREFRRRNLARTIVRALLLEADGRASDLTVHTGNDGAARFWEKVGFLPVAGQVWSHQARLAELSIEALFNRAGC